jgi:hypothetical protein
MSKGNKVINDVPLLTTLQFRKFLMTCVCYHGDFIVLKSRNYFLSSFLLKKKRNNMVKSVGSAFIQELIKYSISFPIYCNSVEFL